MVMFMYHFGKYIAFYRLIYLLVTRPIACETLIAIQFKKGADHALIFQTHEAKCSKAVVPVFSIIL